MRVHTNGTLWNRHRQLICRPPILAAPRPVHTMQAEQQQQAIWGQTSRGGQVGWPVAASTRCSSPSPSSAPGSSEIATMPGCARADGGRGGELLDWREKQRNNRKKGCILPADSAPRRRSQAGRLRWEAAALHQGRSSSQGRLHEAAALAPPAQHRGRTWSSAACTRASGTQHLFLGQSRSLGPKSPCSRRGGVSLPISLSLSLSLSLLTFQVGGRACGQ